MYPTQERIKELRERFDVRDGRFFAYQRYTNMNWYLCQSELQDFEEAEWFCFGDIRDADIDRLIGLLKDDELLALGWKDLSPNRKEDPYGDGGGLCLVISKEGIKYDKRASRKPASN